MSDKCHSELSGQSGASTANRFMETVPVVVNNITYGNAFCALCNLATDSSTPHKRTLPPHTSFWSMGFKCAGKERLVATSSAEFLSKIVSQNCIWTVFPAVEAAMRHLRSCSPPSVGIPLWGESQFARKYKAKQKRRLSNERVFSGGAKRGQAEEGEKGRGSVDRYKTEDVSESSPINRAETLSPVLRDALGRACGFYQYTTAVALLNFTSGERHKVQQPAGGGEGAVGGPAPPPVNANLVPISALAHNKHYAHKPSTHPPQQEEEEVQEGGSTPTRTDSAAQRDQFGEGAVVEEQGASFNQHKFYSAAVQTQFYRNHHCAICDGVPLSALGCNGHSKPPPSPHKQPQQLPPGQFSKRSVHSHSVSSLSQSWM